MRVLLAAAMAVAASSAAVAESATGQLQGPPYRIVADEKGDTHRSVDVRIDRRIDETELAAIANAVASKDAKPYPRVTVNFLLPSGRPGEPPWASATLVREVRVKIPGLRLDEERQFTAEARADKRNMIGSWLTSTPATPGRLTIFREGRQVFAEWRMRSGARSRDEVTETRTAAGQRFDIKSGTSDDHFLVTSTGDLEIRAKGTLIAVAEPIRPAQPEARVAAGSVRDRNTTVQQWPPVAPSGQAVTSTAQSVEPAEQPLATPLPATAAKAGPVKSASRPQPKRPTQATEPRIDLTRFLQPNT